MWIPEHIFTNRNSFPSDILCSRNQHLRILLEEAETQSRQAIKLEKKREKKNHINTNAAGPGANIPVFTPPRH